MMKRTILGIIGATLCLLLTTQCRFEVIDEIGKWNPIEVNRNEITIPANGGSTIVTMYNYREWWIDDVQDYDGRYTTNRRIYDDRTQVNTDWYSLEVPTQDRHTLIIRVDANLTGEPRKIVIDMTVGNSFEKIYVWQNR